MSDATANPNGEQPTIELTLESEPIEIPVVVPIVPEELKVELQTAATSALDQSNLSEDEKEQVRNFAKKIDIKDSQLVLQYGLSCQRKVSDYAEYSLGMVRAKDTGEVGEMLTKLTTELRGFTLTPEKDNGFFGFFKKSVDYLVTMKNRYSSVETNINQITDILEGHKIQMLKDITLLDQMYGNTLLYFKELTMYIMAGKERLDQAINIELPALKKKAEETGLPTDAQAARDFEEMCNRFDKKVHDLDLTRTVAMQMAPQIRMVQNNDSVLVEKINSSVINTIPLWKNQMTLSLGLANSKQALEAQKAVTDMTNELLRKNADILKTSTVEVARESERGIVDIETLKYTNQQLIATIDDLIHVQADGRQKRRQAEIELVTIENELKQKLLSAAGR
jgi:uncharacterized protein YaaN involved in tellurite resistance